MYMPISLTSKSRRRNTVWKSIIYPTRYRVRSLYFLAVIIYFPEIS